MAKLFPEVVNHYKVYFGDANEAVGQSGEVELPDFEAIKETLDGGGILGEIEDPVTGHFEAMKITIPFAVLWADMFRMINTTNTPMVTLRGSMQVMDHGTGETDYVPVRIVLKGKATSTKLGTMKRGGKTESELEMEVFYIKVEVDGETLVELDKLNFVYVLNGVDLMQKVRAQC